jgi:hypothetical protein
MQSEASVVSEVAIFGRLIEPEESNLAPEVARYLLTLTFRQTDRDRMNELAEKAREGHLTKEEDQELNSYIHVGNLLAILQSKARKSLQRTASGS